MNVTLNADQKLYVIACGDGYSCLGFDNASDHASQIAGWLDEFDVFGRIGRSTGTLMVPLLIEAGESGGAAILTSCVLRIVDWTSGRDLYRHPAYRAPDLAIRRAADDPALPWEVLHDGTVAACFADIGKAGAYVAFMCGEVVDPRVFQ